MFKDLRAACNSPFWDKLPHKNRLFRRVTDLPLLFTFFSRYIQSRTCSGRHTQHLLIRVTGSDYEVSWPCRPILPDSKMDLHFHIHCSNNKNEYTVTRSYDICNFRVANGFYWFIYFSFTSIGRRLWLTATIEIPCSWGIFNHFHMA